MGKMGRCLKILVASALMLAGNSVYAQKFSVSTDLLGYARLCTFNVDASYAIARRWSLTAGARYNPFTFNAGDPEKQFQYRQQTYSVGMRLWPWHIWSGWWFTGKLRYQEYSTGGIISRTTEEGDRFGAGLYSGYTHMLTPHLNLEFGVGFWSGLAVYRKYSCPVCGLTIEDGRKFFLLPDDFMVSVVYVF